MNVRYSCLAARESTVKMRTSDLKYWSLCLRVLSEERSSPVALVFWNTAVRLLTDSSPVLRYLKPLEEKGVAVLAGKLCLQELEISHLAVGRAVTMDEILDLFQAWDVVNL